MRDRLAKGAMWVAGTRVLVNLVGFASTILLARLLVPADFGIMAIATTVATLVTSATELSLAAALVQHRDPQDHHFNTAWTMNATRSLLIAGLIAASATALARLYGEPRLANVMLAIAGVTMLGGLANPRLVIFTRKLIFWQHFAMGVSTKVAGFIVSIAVAYVYRSYWALIAGMAAGQLVSLILSYVLVPYRPRFSLAGWRELLSFSVWLSFGQLVNTINWKSDPLFIGYFLGPTTLGFYSYGERLAQLPTVETTAPIAQTLFPAFARIGGDTARLRTAFQKSQTLLTAVALPLGIGFALLADPIIRLLLTEKWLPAVPVIQVLAGIFALGTIGSAARPLGMALGRTQLLFKRDVLGLCIRVPLLMLGAAVAGLPGVLYARIVTWLIGVCINMHLVRMLIDLRFAEQLRANSRSLAAAGAMAVVVGLVQYGGFAADLDRFSPLLSLFGLIFLGALVYLGAMALLWVAAGRPAGPESVAVEVAIKLKARLTQRAAADPMPADKRFEE
jgi:O-antigen/teichoic acid export membrane protein